MYLCLQFFISVLVFAFCFSFFLWLLRKSDIRMICIFLYNTVYASMPKLSSIHLDVLVEHWLVTDTENRQTQGHSIYRRGTVYRRFFKKSRDVIVSIPTFTKFFDVYSFGACCIHTKPVTAFMPNRERCHKRIYSIGLQSFDYFCVTSSSDSRMTTVLTAVDSAVGIVSYLFHFPIVTFTLHLQREPLYYVVNLIVPCCLLSLIAVVTFLLQASSSERLGLGEKLTDYFIL